jgi:hypothetical protein
MRFYQLKGCFKEKNGCLVFFPQCTFLPPKKLKIVFKEKLQFEAFLETHFEKKMRESFGLMKITLPKISIHISHN